jgi:diguanylate cyclase (GGDEF)-like protein
VLEAADGEAGLAMLDANPDIRLTIVDEEMPGMKGHEFTRRLRARHARDHLAIIGISGTSDASLVPRFLKSGANDFLHKPFSREEFFCRVSQNIDQLELIGTLQDLATRDFLTGLPNRRHFLSECHALLPNTLGRQQAVTAAIVDIDHFKHINDTYGHEAGDLALKAVAQTIAQHAGAQDLVARFGGEEFCALVPYLGEGEAVEYFESLRQRIEALRVDVGGQVLRMTVSIGVFRTRFPGQTLNHLLSEADRRLYLAKAGGRNRVVSNG